MKKIIISLLVLLTCFTTVTGLALNTAPAMAAELSKTDVTENFDSNETVTYTQSDGTKTFGNWTVYWGSENGTVKVEDDPTDSGMGKVLRLNNAVASGNVGNGTYLRVMYDETYRARNFTVSYDFYHANGMNTSWQALYLRDENPKSIMSQANTIVMTFQKGRGGGSDVINTSDGGTRTGKSSDVCFQNMPLYSFGGGTSVMRPESGTSESLGRFFNVDGGDVKGTWYSVKIVARGKYYTSYMKYKDSEEWFYMGTTFLADKENKIEAGTIGFGSCGGDYLFDNLSLINEDANPVTATSTAPKEYGEAYAITESAGDKTDVELYMALSDGYVYGNWYKNPECTEEVAVKDLRLQRYQYNDTYYVWEWVDIPEEEVSFPTGTLDDLDALIDVGGQEISVREAYSGSEYRLITTVNTEDSGFNYYATMDKRTYYVAIEVDGDGQVTGTGLEQDGDGAIGKLTIGTTVSLTATPNIDKVFAGWYKLIDVDGEVYRNRLSRQAQFDYVVELGGINVQAVFVDANSSEFTISINKSVIDSNNTEYGAVTAGAGAFYDGEEVSLMATEYAGFSFLRWECNGEVLSTDINYSFYIEEDMLIEAIFETEKYRVYVTDGLGKETTRIVSANSEVKLVAPTAPEGYTFAGWVITGIDDYEIDRATRTATFKATGKNIYAKAQYNETTHKLTVRVSDTSMGTALGSGNYRVGSTVTVRVMAKDGYAVAQYIVRGVDVTVNNDGTCSFVMPANDVIIKVEFATIDDVHVREEIIAIGVFAAIIIVITAALLFINKGDGEGKRGGRAGKRKAKQLRESITATAQNAQSEQDGDAIEQFENK